MRDKKQEKTYVEDVSRSVYDIRNEEKDVYRVDEGLTEAIVSQISKEKNDPAWMQNFRLESLKIYNELSVPDWGPSIDGLDMNNIVTYVRPNTKMSAKWSEVPKEIKDTFDALGIPKAERESLAGVGAQYDSELVYHNVREEVSALGVVYTDMESALHGEYADLVRKHFMKLVPPRDHKFAALHGAVWSGGSFVYVPPGVSVTIPLQSYFRLNAPGAGQFEHTLIIVEEGAELHFIEGCSAPKYNVANLHAGCVELYVGKNAKLRYSTIENWSKNMYNLNTKRAKVEEGGTIEWVSGSFGSHVSYLYPMSILNGKGARAEFTGITFAGKGIALRGAALTFDGCTVVMTGIGATGNAELGWMTIALGSGSSLNLSGASLTLEDVALRGWAGSLAGVWSVFGGFRTVQQYRAARATREAEFRLNEDRMLAVVLSVADCWRSLREARARARVAAKAAEAATLDHAEAARRFDDGRETLSTVLDKIAVRDEAEVNLVRARYAAALASIMLRQAVGLDIFKSEER